MSLDSCSPGAASFFVILILSCYRMAIADVDVTSLQLLASGLTEDQCKRLVPPAYNSSPSEINGGPELDCFQRLLKWVCQLRTSSKDTGPILRNRLSYVHRTDLLRFIDKSASKKFVRDVRTAENQESDYEGQPNENEAHDRKGNETGQRVDDRPFVRLSLKAAAIILAVTVLLTCCCTLLVRRRLGNLCSKGGKKDRSKLRSGDSDDEKRSPLRVLSLKGARKKRKRPPSYEMVQTQPQNAVAPVAAAAPREPEEPAPTGCCRCYRKKRRKSGKRPRR